MNPTPEQRGPIDWMRWIPATLLALIVLVVLLIGGRVILIPVLISLSLAYLLAPVVAWFEHRGWTRSSAVLLTLTLTTVAMILILIFILPSLWGQLRKSYEQANQLISDRERVEQLTNKVKAISPQFYEFAQSQINKFKTPEEQQRVREVVQGWLQSGLFRLVGFTASILDLLLIPFFIYYFLAEYGAMRAQIDRLIPLRFRAITSGLITKINQVFSSYVRSQLLIALAMGLMYSLGFAVLSVPLAFTLGMLSGLLNFVPYLGTLSGLALSVTFVALDGAGPGRLIGVLAVFIIVQSVEGYYLTPKLLGNSLHIHPLWVLIGLMIGGNLFGLLGIILAVPAIAIAKVVLEFLRDIYENSNFYRRAGLNLFTDQGQPVDLMTSPEPSNLILEEAYSIRPRRAVITTGELKSRIRDDKVIVNEDDK